MNANVVNAISNWFFVADKYVKFGASDTEPRAEFHAMLHRLLRGEKPQVPSGVSYPGWGLFSDMAGVGTAAYALSVAARQVVKAAEADPQGLVEAHEYYYGEGCY